MRGTKLKNIKGITDSTQKIIDKLVSDYQIIVNQPKADSITLSRLTQAFPESFFVNFQKAFR